MKKILFILSVLIIPGVLLAQSSVFRGGISINGGQLACVIPATSTPTGTTQDIDWNNGNGQVLDLGSASGNVTVTFTNGVSGASYVLKIIQSATPRTITWPAEVLWQGDTAITLTTTDNAVDIISCFFDGSSYYCNFGNDYR